MSIVTDLALGTASTAAKKAVLPWLIVAGMLALGSVGAAGMYAGYEIATARFAKDKIDMQQAHLDALTASKAALAISIANSSMVSGEFLTALKSMQIVNTTVTNEVRHETEKLIYTDCKLPDSGADLLKRNRDAVNTRLIGKGK